ncbi:MAG: hypothetical protein KHY83_02600 [Coriobacteriia bacterium]|nr:hypothetical protein [Coriobacteriia bacterium]
MVKFVGDRLADDLRRRGCKVVPGEMGDVLIRLPGVALPEEIALDMRSFLGLKELTAAGIGRLW